jgi:hypothetical protein
MVIFSEEFIICIFNDEKFFDMLVLFVQHGIWPENLSITISTKQQHKLLMYCKKMGISNKRFHCFTKKFIKYFCTELYINDFLYIITNFLIDPQDFNKMGIYDYLVNIITKNVFDQDIYIDDTKLENHMLFIDVLKLCPILLQNKQYNNTIRLGLSHYILYIRYINR